jgi:hypothetical protein
LHEFGDVSLLDELWADELGEDGELVDRGAYVTKDDKKSALLTKRASPV